MLYHDKIKSTFFLGELQCIIDQLELTIEELDVPDIKVLSQDRRLDETERPELVVEETENEAVCSDSPREQADKSYEKLQSEDEGGDDGDDGDDGVDGDDDNDDDYDNYDDDDGYNYEEEENENEKENDNNEDEEEEEYKERKWV